MSDPRIEELKALLPRAMLHDWVRLGARAARLLRDRHHLDRHDALLDRLLTRARASAELRERRAARVPRVTYPPELPITARKDELVAAIRSHQVVVVAGETGSGKTTQIPKACLEAGLGIEATIGCTQPRRVAALSISRRIAEELGVGWGREVGCKIRFDDRSSPETFIKLMTDGILLAETQGDPDLSEYNALVIDEAHERSLNIDFLLGHLKGLLARRRDLKLIITSATIDTTGFSRAFGDAPVIEVSGRMHPVEVRYAPLDAVSEDAGETTYVDAAVEAVSGVLDEPGGGDVLVFMPGERDIREATDQLEGRMGDRVEVIPLFGRLSAGDQQRVFAPGGRRRVVVATNIAETSLTIPGIRYVIDTGLARVSRYSPRTRTRRLPVEPIAQSNANQRKGRAGRLRDGVCVRLYSEEDFLGRPAFMQPELQRANLAEVILRMKAFHLGDIETFPFLDPPTPAAIRTGYRLLQELGALDERRELTALGSDLARLPIDPTLGRMLLQSQREHAVRELLIIASGSSIQDPRERPMDRQEEAAAAHRKFVDPRSDFLSLLNLWNAFHEEWESLRTQNQRRRFCKAHFLSYLRMREWQDLHAQLHGALEDLGTVRLNESNADYGAIHRSILAGLLAHVATRTERNQYRGAGGRMLALFPGSVLFERGARPSKERSGPRREEAAKAKSSQPAWIVAGEIVETTQLFARTVAGIDPGWIQPLAPHLCEVAHTQPRWSAADGRVVATEIVTFQGLEVQRRKVAYGNVRPAEATEIFIRSALVEEGLLGEADEDREDEGPAREAAPTTGRRGERERDRARLTAAARIAAVATRSVVAEPAFLRHNRQVRRKIEDWQTRLRRHVFGDLDDAVFRFYAARIEGVSSRDELNRLLRGHPEPEFLHLRESDLTGGRSLDLDRGEFPDQVTVGGQTVRVEYAYAPGEEWDGVTLRLPPELARTVASSGLDWAVPGMRAEQVTELLTSLPKSLRRELQPFAPKVEEIVRELEPAGPTLLHDLSRFVKSKYGIEVPVSAWRPESVPAHLRPRIEVRGGDDRTLASGRSLDELRVRLTEVKAAPETVSAAWEREIARWERVAVTAWNFGDLPERIAVREPGRADEWAWPGLRLEDGDVCLRLFRSPEVARARTGPAARRLVALALQKELAWLRKDLRALQRLGPLYAPIGSVEELEETAGTHLEDHVLRIEPPAPTSAAAFQAAVERARARLQGLVIPWMDRLSTVLQTAAQVRQKIGLGGAGAGAGAGAATVTASASATRSRVLTDFGQLGAMLAAPRPASTAAAGSAARANPLAVEVDRLLPSRFLESVPFERLAHFPRYLKALLIRAERRSLNPPKDDERAASLRPYVEGLSMLRAARQVPEDVARGIEDFRWMLEEYRVSLFAQELGTSVPVSPKRLDEVLARLRLLVR